MPAGEAFNPQQRDDVERAIRRAYESSQLTFSAYVGADAAPDARRRAVALHAQLESPETSVLIYVDPDSRVLEIVTGAAARETLDDARVGLAALGMQQAFAAGDLTTGLVNGINQLGEQGRPFRTLHANSELDLHS